MKCLHCGGTFTRETVLANNGIGAVSQDPNHPRFRKWPTDAELEAKGFVWQDHLNPEFCYHCRKPFVDADALNELLEANNMGELA